MKNNTLTLSLASVLAIGALKTTASANEYLEDYIDVTPQAVTFALTAKYSAPGLTIKDPDSGQNIPSFVSYSETYDKNDNLTKATERYSAVAKTFKYGNAEIIKALIESGTIEGPASGWALLALNSDAGVDSENYEESQGPTIIARKKNFEDVVLPFSIDDSGIGVMTGKGDYNLTNTWRVIDGENVLTSSVVTYSETGTDEGTAKITLPISNAALGEEPLQVSLSGAYSGSGREMTYYPRYYDYDTDKIVTDKSEIYSTWIPGAASIRGVTGSAFSGEFEAVVVFGGTINLAASTGRLILGTLQPY